MEVMMRYLSVAVKRMSCHAVVVRPSWRMAVLIGTEAYNVTPAPSPFGAGSTVGVTPSSDTRPNTSLSTLQRRRTDRVPVRPGRGVSMPLSSAGRHSGT